MIQIGEGDSAKLFATKQEAFTYELGVIVSGILTGTTDGVGKSDAVAKAMMLQCDGIVACLLQKQKRRPRKTKAPSVASPEPLPQPAGDASLPKRRSKNKANQEQAALV